jgi:hypothetical protein
MKVPTAWMLLVSVEILPVLIWVMLGVWCGY